MRLESILSYKRHPLHTRIALGVVLLASLLTLYVWVKAHEQQAQEEVFSFGDSKYPVLFAGDTIRRWEDVQSLGFFSPLFGAERSVVNPATPVVEERRNLRFDEPGEYYLEINREHYLKVLILDPREPISKGVLRIFDFLVANLLVSNGEGPIYYTLGPERYIQRWVQSKDPGLLLCGPTEKMFRTLVFERFRLPNRMVTLSGVYRRDGKIRTSTHNIPEIYLPDIGKFVLFDLNNAFVARWLNAIDLAYLMHSATDDSGDLTDAQWNALGLDLHPGSPKAFRPVNYNIRGNQSDPAVKFTPELVSEVPVERYWVSQTRLFYGGVVYRGPSWYGTGFLEHDYNVGSLHTDPQLEEAVVDLVKSYHHVDPTVQVYSLRELAQMLDRGFRDPLTAKAWLERVPGSVIHAGGKPNRS